MEEIKENPPANAGEHTLTPKYQMNKQQNPIKKANNLFLRMGIMSVLAISTIAGLAIVFRYDGTIRIRIGMDGGEMIIERIGRP